jgi:hypothetical protein
MYGNRGQLNRTTMKTLTKFKLRRPVAIPRPGHVGFAMDIAILELVFPDDLYFLIPSTAPYCCSYLSSTIHSLNKDRVVE